MFFLVNFALGFPICLNYTTFLDYYSEYVIEDSKPY